MALAIGTRVKIKAGRFNSGMKEFLGKTGQITNTERDGQTTMYRVELDEPVNIPNFGWVGDDLWSKEYLDDIDDDDPPDAQN
jgi:hypothetical protein